MQYITQVNYLSIEGVVRRAGPRAAPRRKPRWQTAGPRFSSPLPHGGQGGHPSGGMSAVAGGMTLAKKEHWLGGQVCGQRRGESQGGSLQAHASPRRPHNAWPGKRLTRNLKNIARTPCTRGDGCEPAAALCFGMAPNGEFLWIRKNRHQKTRAVERNGKVLLSQVTFGCLSDNSRSTRTDK